MFAPTKIWRKWHVKINQGQKYVEHNLAWEEDESDLFAIGASLLPLPSRPRLWLPS